MIDGRTRVVRLVAMALSALMTMARLAAAPLTVALLLTMLAPGAFTAHSSHSRASSVVLVSGDRTSEHDTIAAAVASASDGDEVLVPPGVWSEAVAVDKDVTIRGDGPRSEVILQAPIDGPTYVVPRFAQVPERVAPYVLRLSGAGPTVADLTLRGRGATIFVEGGAPTITGVEFDGAPCPVADGPVCDGDAITVIGSAQVRIVGNRLVRSGPINILEDATVTLERNEIIDGRCLPPGSGSKCALIWVVPDGTIIRDNRIESERSTGISLGGPAVVERNSIMVGDAGIRIWDEVAHSIRDNTISGASAGITLVQREDRRGGDIPTIEGNRIIDNSSGIVIARSDALIRNNVLGSNGVAISVEGGSPTIEHNRIEGNGAAIALLSTRAAPIVADNLLCDNDEDVRAMRSVEPLSLDGNTTCPAAPRDADTQG